MYDAVFSYALTLQEDMSINVVYITFFAIWIAVSWRFARSFIWLQQDKEERVFGEWCFYKWYFAGD